MPKFYVSKRANAEGVREVHHQNCLVLPGTSDFMDKVGDFDRRSDAVSAAAMIAHDAGDCKVCGGVAS